MIFFANIFFPVIHLCFFIRFVLCPITFSEVHDQHYFRQQIYLLQMKQQSHKTIVTRPAKSLSARNFFKMHMKEKDRQERKQYNTLQTEPVQTPIKKLATTSRLQAHKSHKQAPTMKIRQASFFVPQELKQQNMKLKQKVNRLTQDLMKQRVKRTQDSKHLNKMQREVEAQFDDDKYMDVSKNQGKLIEGVKHQYQKMKQKYQQKCADYNQLLKRYEISGGEQYKFQCDSLHIQNKKLRDKLEILLSTEERITKEYQLEKNRIAVEKGKSLDRVKLDQNDILDLLGVSSQFVIMKKKNEDLHMVNKKYDRKVVKLRKELEQKNHKIAFLDKLLIEKSNENHHLIMNQRKVGKENKVLHHSLEEMKARLEREMESRKFDLQYLKEKEKVKFQTQKAIFVKSLIQKDQEIQKLREELKYVTTLIQYLKMGDQNIHFQSGEKFNPLGKQPEGRQRSQDMLYNMQMSLKSMSKPQEVRERVKTLFQSNFRQPSSSYGLRQTANPKLHSNTQTLRKLQMNQDDDQIVISVKGSPRSSINGDDAYLQSRVVKKSHLKHHPDSIRMKHVKLPQLQSFRLWLMYRFIHYRVSTQDAKNLLDFAVEEGQHLSKKEMRWKNRYLSMRQARQKFTQYPFNLNEEQSILLARYIVQDASKDDVFFSQDNEIQRTIAKSILRAFVGEYNLPDIEASRREIKQVLESTTGGKNLQSALETLAPTGTIPYTNLMEISRGIQVQFSQSTWNYILSQLSFRSEGGLQKLNYQLLFQNL